MAPGTRAVTMARSGERRDHMQEVLCVGPSCEEVVGASVSLRQKRILTKTAVKGIERPLLPFGA